MTHNTGIEWTHLPGFKGETWNPVTGCSVVSPGCTNCYAMQLAGTRLADHPAYEGLTQDSKAGPVWTGDVRALPGRLLQPLKWRAPRAVFVNSMGDLFHDGVSEEFLDEIFAVMALCPQHIFMVLTKRADRMRAYFAGEWLESRVSAMAEFIDQELGLTDPNARLSNDGRARYHPIGVDDGGPLPNVWLGVSAEDQARADERIPLLLETPAAVRFVSCEPLLGAVDLRDLSVSNQDTNGIEQWNALDRVEAAHAGVEGGPDGVLDWVIAGGESGEDHRPVDEAWLTALRDQCAAADVPFFFKQWSGVQPKRRAATLAGSWHRDFPPLPGAKVDPAQGALNL